MKTIRVAMVAPPWLSIPPEGYGGIENVVAALVPELMKLGVKVELFATGDTTLKTTKTHWVYKEGQYDHIHKPSYDMMPIALAQVMNALNTVQEDGAFDIIHDHSLYAGPLALYFASDNKRLPPAVHTIHGPPFTTCDRIELGIPDNLPMWRQIKERKKLFFVGISQSLTDSAPTEMQQVLLDPIHNAVDIDLFPFSQKKDDYFMTLARFHPDKGQSLAVKACLQLGQKLKMAGGVGNIMSANKVLLELANPLSTHRGLIDFRYFSDHIFPHLLDGTIVHLGEVKGERKLNLLSKAKALLNPIQWEEPFGMVAIEALACGTPVIAMNRGAMPEIIEHGKNGFLVNNFRELKEYMARVGEIDPVVCRASVEEKFSAKKMAERYLEAYKKVIALTS